VGGRRPLSPFFTGDMGERNWISKIGKRNLFGGFQSPKMRETDCDIWFSECSKIKEGSWKIYTSYLVYCPVLAKSPCGWSPLYVHHW
jgi:hypothetical protein